MECYIRSVPRFFVSILLLSVSGNAAEYAHRYDSQLAQLDQKRPDSECKARDTLRLWLPKARVDDQVAMFRAFLQFTAGIAISTRNSFSQSVQPVNGTIDSILKKKFWKRGQFAATRKSERRSGPGSTAVSEFIRLKAIGIPLRTSRV